MIIARLHITLADVTPSVVRVVDVPVDFRLSRLHLVIQAAMPWSNDHLYKFRAQRECWDLPDDDLDFPIGSESYSANRESLADILWSLSGKTFDYIYDFGDNWLHRVEVERLFQAEDGVDYPRLVDACGACPPEDCGGPWVYAEMVEALADADHDRHEEITKRLGKNFDPRSFDKAALATEVAKLACKSRAKLAAKSLRAA